MPRKRIEIPDNVADLVGRTPMVSFTRLTADLDAEVIGKLEAYNPAGSVKDRIGVAMIAAAEAEGRIEPGRDDRDRADVRATPGSRSRSCAPRRATAASSRCPRE